MVQEKYPDGFLKVDNQPRDILFFNAELIRKENKEIDKILNKCGKPSIDTHLRDIFSTTGVIIGNYQIKAQPYLSAFMLSIRRTGKRSFFINFTLNEILNKDWNNNKKIPIKIKKVLDRIYDDFVIPKKDKFDAVLEGKKVRKPFLYQQFKKGQIMKPNTVLKVICPIDRSEKLISYCQTECVHFRGLTKDQNHPIKCDKITVIEI